MTRNDVARLATRPEDAADFGPAAEPPLRAAMAELSWLLDRGYSRPPALRLVGDRHELNRRQRKAVSRCAASRVEVVTRAERRLSADDLRERTLCVDGYNVLLTVLSAAVGAPLLVGRDGVYRDVASLTRWSRQPGAMERVLHWTAETLAELAPAEVVFHLDRPVSGSGELRGRLERCGHDAGLPWRALLDDDPDRALSASRQSVATADSAILDAGPPSFDLARHVIDRQAEANDLKLWLVDLRT